ARPRTYLAENGPAIDWDEKGVVKNFEKCSYTRENQALRHDAATCIQDAYRRHRGWPLHSSLPKLDSEMGAADAPCAEFVPTWVDSSESLSTKVRRDASQDMQIDLTPYEAKLEQVTRCQALVRRFLALRQYKRVHARVRPVVELEAVLDEDDPYQHFLVRHPGSRSIPPITWDTCGRLPQPRHNHTAAFLDGYVYLVGGFDMRNTHLAIKYATRTCFRMALEETGAGQWERDEFDRFLASVEIYDPAQDQWSECPVPLCCKMSALGAAYHAGYLHIAGGVIQSRRRTDKVFLVPSVEHWDSVCQRWLREAAQLPSGRGSLALVSYMDQLFAVGGPDQG
ncbi:hypothetical protein MTO96_006839, partial [Rhipicephalus appendiculatus]